MKQILFVWCCVFSLVCSLQAYANHATSNARLKQDTIIVNQQTVNYLTLLGEVWGFLKYHHPAVAAGKFDMDLKLIQVLPDVLKSQNNDSLSLTIERWIDGFGIPEICKKCKNKLDKDVAETPDYGDIFNNYVFQTSLKNKLQYILDNRATVTNYYVMLNPVAGNPVFTNEQPYNDMLYPTVEYRLLSVYRYWNMVQYFYPYKNLIGTAWNKTLAEFIPRFIKASDKTEYVLTALGMVCSLHDSHANIRSGNAVLENYRGLNILPAQAKFIENKLVITGYYNDTLNIKEQLKVGDIITSVNGITVDSLIKKYRLITSGSNEAVVFRNMPESYLLRSDDNDIKLEILRDDKRLAGQFSMVKSATINHGIEYAYNPAAPAYTLLDENIGYIFAGKYKNKDLPKIKQMLDKSKGLIIDLRGGPSDNISYTLAPYLKTGSPGFFRLMKGSVSYPGMFTTAMEPSARNLGKYEGKVIVLVNEITQSAGETAVLALQGSPNIMVIGSTTAGADGDVSKIILPGGINTYISGIGMLYPDGTQLQRKGIKIDQFVNPTIAGVKAGRDEVLETAKKLISDQ